jgi:signal peptidase I
VSRGMTRSSAGQAPRRIRGALSGLADAARIIVIAFIVALGVRIVLVQPFHIPSASMDPTLTPGDYVLVDKTAYGWSRHALPLSAPLFSGRLAGRLPARGDVLVFKLPADGRTDYVKRVIGLPGDRIEMRDGVVLLNERTLAHDALGVLELPDGYGATRRIKRFRERLPDGRSYITLDSVDNGALDTTRPVTVPSGHVFVMGDNRDESRDSREIVGFVPVENLVGRVRIVVVSMAPEGSWAKPWEWRRTLRGDRFWRPIG